MGGSGGMMSKEVARNLLKPQVESLGWPLEPVAFRPYRGGWVLRSNAESQQPHCYLWVDTDLKILNRGRRGPMAQLHCDRLDYIRKRSLLETMLSKVLHRLGLRRVRVREFSPIILEHWETRLPEPIVWREDYP